MKRVTDISSCFRNYGYDSHLPRSCNKELSSLGSRLSSTVVPPQSDITSVLYRKSLPT